MTFDFLFFLFLFRSLGFNFRRAIYGSFSSSFTLRIDLSRHFCFFLLVTYSQYILFSFTHVSLYRIFHASIFFSFPLSVVTSSPIYRIDSQEEEIEKKKIILDIRSSLSGNVHIWVSNLLGFRSACILPWAFHPPSSFSFLCPACRIHPTLFFWKPY